MKNAFINHVPAHRYARQCRGRHQQPVRSGAVLGNQAYGPYGNTRYSKGSVGTPKGFTGQIADPISGLDDDGARYYDPVVGRFVSAGVVQVNTFPHHQAIS